MNLTILKGNVGNVPISRSMANGASILTFSLGTNEHWFDKEKKEKKTLTEWHQITLFGKLAESIGPYIKKGSELLIKGKLRSNLSHQENGKSIKFWNMIADSVEFCGKKDASSTSTTSSHSVSPSTPPTTEEW